MRKNQIIHKNSAEICIWCQHNLRSFVTGINNAGNHIIVSCTGNPITLHCKICCAVSNTYIIALLARGDKGNLILDIILYMLSLLALLILYLAKQVFNFFHNKVLPHCWEHPDPNSFKKRFISGNCVFCVAHCTVVCSLLSWRMWFRPRAKLKTILTQDYWTENFKWKNPC